MLLFIKLMAALMLLITLYNLTKAINDLEHLTEEESGINIA